jgi:hypothetical protein
MIGIGLKPQHLPALEGPVPAPLDLLEVHAENLIGCGGPWPARVAALRERHALSLHGVGLSLGGLDRPDPDHLRGLHEVLRRFEPLLFSEHLAWSSHGGIGYHDLLPVPYDNATLQRVCAHIDDVQHTLGRTLLLENPSTYLRFAGDTWSEGDFLAEVVRRTGCGLLVDVTNAHVSAVNHGLDPRALLDALPAGAVGELHLAGFAVDTVALPPDPTAPASLAGSAPMLIDTHGAPVDEAVWSLYAHALCRFGAVPTIVERDQNLPPWDELLAEAGRARGLQRALVGQSRCALPTGLAA